MQNLSKDPGIRAKQIREFARAFNPTVKEHNRVCPGHRVAPIPVGPSPVP